jgi:hypothetical protein
MKVWISKYALSEGIKEAEDSYDSGGYVHVLLPGAAFRQCYKFGTDAHLTREAALAAAESMRTKKIASLKKRIAKLEALRFE